MCWLLCAGLADVTDGVTSDFTGFSDGSSCEESACQCRRCKRCRFDPWVGMIPWRRKWQPTPVFLPGESHGRRSLVGYSQWGHTESDMTEYKHLSAIAFLQGVCPIVITSSSLTLSINSWWQTFNTLGVNSCHQEAIQCSKLPFHVERMHQNYWQICLSPLPGASGLAPRILSPGRFNRVGTEHRPGVAALEGIVPSSNSNAIACGTHLYSKTVAILPAPNCPEAPMLHIF